MYKLPETALAAADTVDLKALQDGVNTPASYVDRVKQAADSFDAKPTALFRRVRAKLAEMSGDLVRCSYCEDSCADEVEHIKPKSFYPEVVYDWDNYLFACGPCNGRKLNQYPLLVAGVCTSLQAERKANGIVAPPVGDAYFINPRSEEPLDYIWLDVLGGTFMLSPLSDDDDFDQARADKTITILRLNREAVRKARENAYGGYRDRLAQLAARIAAGASAEEVQSRKADIARSPHRTVWLEMKRQAALLPELAVLFAAVPEAMTL